VGVEGGFPPNPSGKLSDNGSWLMESSPDAASVPAIVGAKVGAVVSGTSTSSVPEVVPCLLVPSVGLQVEDDGAPDGAATTGTGGTVATGVGGTVAIGTGGTVAATASSGNGTKGSLTAGVSGTSTSSVPEVVPCLLVPSVGLQVEDDGAPEGASAMVD